MTYKWRGAFENDEVSLLHAEAFETEGFGEDEWKWTTLTSAHSLGWVTARDGYALVGFVNVLWDVDFDAELGDFYLKTCGFRPTGAGLIALQD